MVGVISWGWCKYLKFQWIKRRLVCRNPYQLDNYLIGSWGKSRSPLVGQGFIVALGASYWLRNTNPIVTQLLQRVFFLCAEDLLSMWNGAIDSPVIVEPFLT